METNVWSEQTQIYKLTDEYSIQRAKVDEWGIYCSIYYNASYNGFFREELYNRARNNAFWIYKGEMKIGGVRMAPNLIYHLFFIPPFRNDFEVFKRLKMILIQWSDRANPIKTFEVLPDQVPLYARAGFWPDEFRCRWMQRPTDHFEMKWDSNVIIQSPQIEDNDAKSGKRFTNEDEIAHCDFHSFKGGFEAVRRNQTALADFIPHEDPNLTNDRLLLASTLVYDRASGELIANCRLCLQDNVAAVYSIGVLPAHRGKGLATLMLKRALTILKDYYPILRLYVMEGNEAESVYYNLGFIPGVQEIQGMRIPAKG